MAMDKVTRPHYGRNDGIESQHASPMGASIRAQFPELGYFRVQGL